MTELEIILGLGLIASTVITSLTALYLARHRAAQAGMAPVPMTAPTAQPAMQQPEEAEEPAESSEDKAGEPSRKNVLEFRKQVIAEMERQRGAKVITMIYRKEPWSASDEEPEMGMEDIERVLMEIRETPRGTPLDLILHIPDAVNFASNLIAMGLKHHQGKKTVIVPYYAMSGGTMVALAADEVLMERYSILGPVNPVLDGMPSAGWMAVSKTKPINAISDRTLVMSDVGAMLTQNAKDFVRWLLRDTLGDDQAAKVAEFLAGGYLASETPITLDVVKALGINAKEGVPELVYRLFESFEFSGLKRPSFASGGYQ